MFALSLYEIYYDSKESDGELKIPACIKPSTSHAISICKYPKYKVVL